MLPFFDDDHASLRSRARAWVEEHLIPTNEPSVDIEMAAIQWVQRLGKDEFLAYTIPREYGGKRTKVQARDLCILREELARGSALADTMFALQGLGSYPVTLAGSESQKRRYLPRIATGEAIAAFALTEPESGSDVASLRTRAIKRENQYSISGTKSFISNAGIADHYVVFASTAPEKKAKGITAFFVDAQAPGLTVIEKTIVMSPHPIGVIGLVNCIVAGDSVLGAEGQGFSVALGTLDLFRCSVGAAAVGLAQRAMEEAIAYSTRRRQFGRAISELQGIQFKLADMATELEAARLLVYQAAWAYDRGDENAQRQSSMAKLYATESAQRIIDQALQIHGGVGVVAGNIMERLYRDIRALRIYEGTSEIQKLVIARSLLNEPRRSKIAD